MLVMLRARIQFLSLDLPGISNPIVLWYAVRGLQNPRSRSDLARTFASRFDQIQQETVTTDVDQHIVDFFGLERRHFTRADFSFEVVHCFHRIFSLPWFKRVWLLQEVASNSHVIVRLRGRHMAWTDLRPCVRVVYYLPLSLPDDWRRLRVPVHVKSMGTFWPTPERQAARVAVRAAGNLARVRQWTGQPRRPVAEAARAKLQLDAEGRPLSITHTDSSPPP
jgi:hypothetical protein